MKKTLIVCAVLSAFARPAFAQLSVRVYGSVDGGLRNLTNVDAAGNSKLTISSNGTYKSNRLGFEGTEDLGNGLNAHFNLESRFKLGTGEQVGVLFNAASYVGLGGAWGSVDVGRQFTLAFKTILPYDPFGMKYTGFTAPIQATLGVDDNNAIQYNGTFGAFTGRLVYAPGEQVGSSGNGSTQGAALSYVNGPLNFGGAYTRKKSLTGLDTNHYTAGGAYQFGAFRALVGYADQTDQVLATSDTNTSYAWTGLQYNVNALVQIVGSYYQTRKTQAGATPNGKKDMAVLGVTYNLSKRSNLYAEIDRAKFSGNMVTVGQTGQTGMSAGLNHLF